MVLRCKRKVLLGTISLMLLSLMMIFQSEKYMIKLILLGLIFLFASYKIRISKQCLFFYFSYVIFGLWGTMIGILNFTPYPFSSITTTVIYPILSVIIITLLNTENSYKQLIKVMFVTHTFIVLYDIIYCFSVIIGFSFPLIYSNISEAFSFYGTSSRLNFVNLNTLTFTTPVFFLLWITKYDFGIGRKIQFVIILLTSFLCILSGRRSFMLVFVAIPIVLFLLKDKFNKDVSKQVKKMLLWWSIIILSFFAFFAFFYSDILAGYWDVFSRAFDSGREPIKFAQSKMLINEFMKSPIVGQGFGQIFYEPSPGREIWSHQYELQYHLKLAQTGIIGFLFLVISYFGILFYGFYLFNRKHDILLFSFLIGFFFVLVADATNPVLCSFDLMPPLFLCLAKINYNTI